MIIFSNELRQLRTQTIWWSLSMAVLIFAMLPMYVDMISAGTIDLTTLGSSGIFEMLGADIRLLTTPIGMFGWLTSFFALAGGIYGMFLGLKTFSKETVGQSAEFLYTKPARRRSIFCAKVSAGLVSAIIVGLSYLLGAWASAQVNLAGQMEMRAFLLIGLSFMLVEIFFVLFGALVGALHPKVRAPLLMSSGAVFMFYVLAAFASKVQADVLKFITPFSYFGASGIVKNGLYNLGYLTAFVVLGMLFYGLGHLVFIKKDVTFIA
ncbi:MAG: ABC transporter permease [Actinomycetia bacterium]|nr:ABC transporter permease [Actinomycetes bacterium]